jgi:hypothetical protein
MHNLDASDHSAHRKAAPTPPQVMKDKVRKYKNRTQALERGLAQQDVHVRKLQEELLRVHSLLKVLLSSVLCRGQRTAFTFAAACMHSIGKVRRVHLADRTAVSAPTSRQHSGMGQRPSSAHLAMLEPHGLLGHSVSHCESPLPVNLFLAASAPVQAGRPSNLPGPYLAE